MFQSNQKTLQTTRHLSLQELEDLLPDQFVDMIEATYNSYQSCRTELQQQKAERATLSAFEQQQINGLVRHLPSDAAFSQGQPTTIQYALKERQIFDEMRNLDQQPHAVGTAQQCPVEGVYQNQIHYSFSHSQLKDEVRIRVSFDRQKKYAGRSLGQEPTHGQFQLLLGVTPEGVKECQVMCPAIEETFKVKDMSLEQQLSVSRNLLSLAKYVEKHQVPVNLPLLGASLADETSAEGVNFQQVFQEIGEPWISDHVTNNEYLRPKEVGPYQSSKPKQNLTFG